MSGESSSEWDLHYRKPVAWQSYPDENLVRLIRKLQPEKDSALDYGCGSGRHISLLKNEGFKRINACDLSSESEKVSEIYQVPFAQLEKNMPAPYPDCSFTLVVAWGVLHYNSPETQVFILKDIQRMLRPGGWMFGTVRAKSDSHLKEISAVRTAEVNFFDEPGLQSLLAPYCSEVQTGYTERTEPGNLQNRICHYFFAARFQDT